MWGSDFPHPDGVWPDSSEVIARELGHLPRGGAPQDRLRERLWPSVSSSGPSPSGASGTRCLGARYSGARSAPVHGGGSPLAQSRHLRGVDRAAVARYRQAGARPLSSTKRLRPPRRQESALNSPRPSRRSPGDAQQSAEALLQRARAEQRRIDTRCPPEREQQQARDASEPPARPRPSTRRPSRHLLRALYSPDQLQEQMTWFWMNHFSVFQLKANLRVARRLRGARDPAACPRRFRDLLGDVARHPRCSSTSTTRATPPAESTRTTRAS